MLLTNRQKRDLRNYLTELSNDETTVAEELFNYIYNHEFDLTEVDYVFKEHDIYLELTELIEDANNDIDTLEVDASLYDSVDESDANELTEDYDLFNHLNIIKDVFDNLVESLKEELKKQEEMD